MRAFVYRAPVQALRKTQQQGAKYTDYHSFPEGEGTELLLWTNNDPVSCLNPTQIRLGQGQACQPNTQDTTKLHQITLIPWQVLNLRRDEMRL